MAKPIFEVHILVSSGIETYFFHDWTLIEESVRRTWCKSPIDERPIISKREYTAGEIRPHWKIMSPDSGIVYGKIVVYQTPHIEKQVVHF